MSTKPNTEKGWRRDLSTLADGDYFSRVDEYDKWPTLIQIENGAVYEMGQGGDQRREYAAEDYEYLGPFAPSDFEQLIRLREIAGRAIDVMDVVFSHLKLDYVKQIADELREALTPKGE